MKFFEFLWDKKWGVLFDVFVLCVFMIQPKINATNYFLLLFVLAVSFAAYRSQEYFNEKIIENEKSFRIDSEDSFLRMMKMLSSELSYPTWNNELKKDALDAVKRLEIAVMENRKR